MYKLLGHMPNISAAILIFMAIPIATAKAKPHWPKKLRVQLHSPGETLPVCWGHPQDCHGKGGSSPSKPSPPPAQEYSAQLRVECYYSNGTYAGDHTITGRSRISIDDAKNNALSAWNSTRFSACHGIDVTASPRGEPRWLS